MSPEKIRGEIRDLPRDNPAKCEGLIRKLYKRITSLQDYDERENLLDELEGVACWGLQEDLKKMLKENGLHLEALHLVLRYLTNTGELAEYLYRHSEEDLEKEGLASVNKRLRPHLEVHGGLIAEGVDVTKEWVKRLCGKAPSLKVLSRLESSELQSYCQGADDGEMDQVRHLVETAKFNGKKKPPDVPLVQDTKATKAVDEANLKKAKELMNEAKTIATDKSETAKKTVNDKIKLIMETIELPLEWFKQDQMQPDQMFQQLDQIIDQCSEVVEADEIYKNAVEVITKASAGKALFGIYHSEYVVPTPAGRPLLLPPTDVSLTNPSISKDMKFMKFSSQGAAADYIRTVESLNTNIGLAIAGLEGLLFGEVQGARGSEQQKQFHDSFEEQLTSVSVLHYIRTPTRSFLLERYQIKLCESAREMARSIVQDTKIDKVQQQNMAREFFKRFGSHFPAGVQTLGGVFFSIADAESKGAKKKFQLMEAATGYLKVQMSVGFLGVFNIGGSIAGEHTSSKGSNVGKYKESRDEVFTYSVRSIGPTATNTSTFQKLLSYNSTWALIDRGPVEGYIPVWELLKDLGSVYKTAADVLEEIWQCDENKRKVRKIAKDELLLMKEDFIAGVRIAKL